MFLLFSAQNINTIDSSKATIYAGIAAAERIDEYLKSELDCITDSDSNASIRKENSNVTTAVALIHKSNDELQYSPLTLDRRSVLNHSDKTIGANDNLDRRPSGLGPQLTLPVMHDPSIRRRSVGEVQTYADGTLDVKTYKIIEEKYFSTLNRTLSFRSDPNLSIKSISLGDLNIPESTFSSKNGSKINSASRSMMDLNEVNGSSSSSSNSKFKSAHEGEYGTLR